MQGKERATSTEDGDLGSKRSERNKLGRVEPNEKLRRAESREEPHDRPRIELRKGKPRQWYAPTLRKLVDYFTREQPRISVAFTGSNIGGDKEVGSSKGGGDGRASVACRGDAGSQEKSVSERSPGDAPQHGTCPAGLRMTNGAGCHRGGGNGTQKWTRWWRRLAKRRTS